MKNMGRLAFVILLTIGSCTVQRRPYYEYGGNRAYGGNREALSMQYFYDELSPYGNWVHNREYGYVWIPNVGRNFYPYATNGRWVATEYGWTWVSGYDWGWAPFHYGRWDYDEYYGWFWFPDDEWGPAWVTWRRGDGYYGWAPMGPGNSMGRQGSYSDPYRWVFVRDRDFGKSDISRYHVNPRRNIEIMRSSRVIDNAYADNSGRSYNAGPDIADVQRSTGRRINRVTVRDSDRPQTRLSSNQLQIYRPRIQRSADVASRPAPSRITDIKDIRPMRERNRNYQPSSTSDDVRNYSPERSQGSQQNSNIDERARDTRRQYEEKQGAMERQQQQAESEQNQRSVEVEPSRPVQRREADRKAQTDQQKRIMRKERETRRQSEADSTPSRKVEREVISRPRRR